MLRRLWPLLLTLLLLAACSTAAEEQPTPAPPQSSADEPRYGGVIKMISVAAPDTLDPHRGTSSYTHNAIGLVYNKLLTYPTGEGVEYTDYSLIPELAQDWDISHDGLTYTFYLRDDVRWHDVPPVNGRPFVADDVVATMERIRSLPGHQAYMLNKVARIEAPDEHTVVFTLTEPYAPFLHYMANHYMWILPREAAEGRIDLDNTAIGTGPFQLDSFDRSVGRLVYSKNEHYWKEGLPYLDGVEINRVADQGSRVAAFRTGQADVYATPSPEEAQNIVSTHPQVVQKPYLSANHVILLVNPNVKPLDDIRVRQAINHAIDANNMVLAITHGGEVSGPIPPTLGEWALSKEERNQYAPYDPEKAKALLAEAGYPDGFSLTMISYPVAEELIRAAQWVIEDLKKVGIQVTLEVQEISTLLSKSWPQLEYEMGIVVQASFQEADEWLYGQYHSQGGRNWFGVNDPKLDQMLEEQRKILDHDQRVAKVHEIQRYISQEVMNPIPLVIYNNYYLSQPHVRNWDFHASYGWTHMDRVWLDK